MVLAGDQPLEIEIGYGRGDFLLDRAQRLPDWLFIGYETKTGTRLLLARVEHGVLLNVWLSDDDVRFSLPWVIVAGCCGILTCFSPTRGGRNSTR